MNNRMVSIIVPVYNAKNFIEETISCVRRQTYQDWELLLVDDVSTDDTMSVINAYLERVGDARIRVIKQPANKGAAHARNRGLEEACGRYIAYLDADDLWLPDKLEKEVCYMEEKSAAFVFTGYEFADELGAGTGKIVRVPTTLNYHQALKNTTIFTSTVMFDTSRIERELLQMPIVKSEDTALWWKILRNGYIAYGLDENLVLYRRSGKTLSSNKLEAIRRIWSLYRKQERLNVFTSFYHLCFWAFHAVGRRI